MIPTVRALKSSRVAIAVLGLAVVLLACSSKPSTPSGNSNTPTTGSTCSSTSAPTTGVTLTGKWSGTYTSTSKATGTFTILFCQNGTQLTGSIDIQNSPCISTGTISGLLRDTTLAFGVVKGEQRIDYAGTISGNTISGNYSAPQCGNAEGTWTATKTG